MSYDVIVLGGGSAGTSAASAAARCGARTLMINDGELGGLCILRGCMPTKAILASAHALHDARGAHLQPLGARLEGQAIPDFRRIMQRKDAIVRRFQDAKIEAVHNGDYELRDGRGRFVEGGAVEVDGERLEARSYVIATGSVPSILPLPGIDDVPVLTSDDVMRLTEPPQRLLVQGAGPVGLELAQFFARIGTEVLLVNRSPLLSRYDPECGEELLAALRAEPCFEAVIPGRIEKLERHGDGLRASIDSEGRRFDTHADSLLMAVGRRVAADDLGLEHIGVELDDGRIVHDERMAAKTNPRIFVCGDVTGAYQVLHLSNREGIIAGHNAAGGDPEWQVDYRLKMTMIFTNPPYAQVGATEAEAQAQGFDTVVGCVRFPDTGRAITLGVKHGAWKLVCDRNSGEILGSSLLGPRADDLAHLISVMMHHRSTVDEIFRMPWYHPTLSEVMLNLARKVEAQRPGALEDPCVPGDGEMPPGAG